MGKCILKKGGAWAGVLLLIAFIWYCKNPGIDADYYSPPALATHFNGKAFVGSQTCRECHADIFASHMNTAHYNTSAPASGDNIKGSFEEGSNILELGDALLEMESVNGAYYETTNPVVREEKGSSSRLDIVIGSGVKGQSYLTWRGDSLYQVQASYYTPSDRWINSPNFPEYHTRRPITDACLKCHVTFARNRDKSGNSNQYLREQMVLGIDCERCHSPLREHVVFHRQHPGEETARYVLAIDSLPRQKRLDICVQCHSGLRARQLKGNPFSFVAGENLGDYSKNYDSGRPQNDLDVHGNQFGLLKSSKCFIQTPAMDCTTCHDPHRDQRGDTDYFNQKCMQCHNNIAIHCSRDQTAANAMGNDCISCHMPLAPSRTMKVRLAEDTPEIPVYIRTHFITVYPDTPGKREPLP